MFINKEWKVFEMFSSDSCVYSEYNMINKEIKVSYEKNFAYVRHTLINGHLPILTFM
jgi:hypothetical protein